jgi:hypothetical protein
VNDRSGDNPDRTSARPAQTSNQIDYGAIGLIGGGFLVFVGAYLNWFNFSVSAAGFGVTSGSANGTTDWTGTVAVIAGIAAIVAGGAALLLGEDVKRVARLVGTVTALLALIATVIAFFRVNDVGIDFATLGGPTASIDVQAAAGLYASFLGAVIATVGGAMSVRRNANL